jgi:hypothetical protein
MAPCRETADPSLQLAKRCEAAAGERQRVRHPDRAGRREEGRLEGVLVGQVAARDGEWQLRLKQELAAALGID